MLESSSEEELIKVDEDEKPKATKSNESKATSPKIAKIFGSSKSDNKSQSTGKNENKTKADSPVKPKSEAKSPIKQEVKVSPVKNVVKEVKEMKLTKEEKTEPTETKLFSKSTSNFFNGKKTESTTAGSAGGSSISVSNSTGGKSN